MYKTMLQELCQKQHWKLPEYSTVKDGPSNNISFTATVKVKGEIFTSPNAGRSIKEAQNTAAQVAYTRFSEANQEPPRVDKLLPQPPPEIFDPPPYGDFIQLGAVNETCCGAGIKMQNGKDIALSDLVHSGAIDSHGISRISHVYKNQLQQYAQKNNWAFPVYTNEADGPPHARRFRSTVSVGGKDYKSLEFFSTVKEAEQAAARIACQELSVDLNQEDVGMFKNLLQELTQKSGLPNPIYETIRSGFCHNLSFSSTVHVQGYKFKGPMARSKKQAEMMVAKIAYLSLTKGPPVAADTSQNIQHTMPATNNQDITRKEAENRPKRANFSPDNIGEKQSSSAPSSNLMKSVSGNSNLASSQMENCSIAERLNGQSVEIKPTCNNRKIVVFPRNSTYPIPKGAVVQACDEEWVAYEVDEGAELG